MTPTRTRRPGLPTAVPAVLLVLATGAALLAVSGAPLAAPTDRPPTTTALTSQQVLCPDGLAGSVAVSSTEASGSVGVGLGRASDPVAVSRGRTTSVPQPGPLVVDGRATLAPGLVAGVSAAASGAGVACAPPRSDYWFTGVGAASIHASSLELVNPDAGPAVAQVEVLGTRGPVAATKVSSVTVPGGSATTVDLPTEIPTRVELAIHVTVVRGRLGASLLDRIRDLSATSDWLASEPAPATASTLLGLAPDVRGETTDRRLVLANPGADQATVTLEIVGAESTYAPLGLAPVQVPSGSVVVVDLGAVLGRALAREESGLSVVSDQPVTATLRTVAGGDLSHAVAAPTVTDAALLLPSPAPGSDARATLVLAAPGDAGAAEVTAYDAQGRLLRRLRVGVHQDTAVPVALPAGTSLLTVTATGAAVAGAVRVASGAKVVVLPLQQLVTTGLVPAVAAAQSGR